MRSKCVGKLGNAIKLDEFFKLELRKEGTSLNRTH